jgi:feruloyl esterase
MARAVPVLLLLVVVSWSAMQAATPNCEAISNLALPGTTITDARSVAAGTFNPPDGKPIPNLPAFCRVAGLIKPTNDSNIQFEVWMPSAEWNGKFQGVGNGGFAGSINFAGMANAVSHGYATASTDTGHQGTAIDGTWALGRPEKIVDFGYRAIHETATQAKTIIHAFYGEAPRRSYFGSCSNGGRQALMEAQRFPEDYDGIIAGAPANYWTHLLTQAVWNIQATMQDPGSYIPASKVQAVESAALAACDSLDGVQDGVIDDPMKCHFDPSGLLCHGPETDSCLTAAEVGALKKIYAGPQDSKGHQVMPGFSPGGESGPGGWGLWITGPAPGKSLQFAFGTQFFGNMVYSNPAWDFRTFNVDQGLKAAEDKFAPVLNATDADLHRFHERGGKLILYHGWSDAAIPPVNAINYYQSVVAKMGAKNAEPFLRLYMVPGMQHCGGGPGPNSFGAGGVAHTDPLHDMDAALERWVEEGVAPDRIIATKYKTDSDAASGILRTRPLCAYPKAAQWKGSGSTDDAANFACVKPGDAPFKGASKDAMKR